MACVVTKRAFSECNFKECNDLVKSTKTINAPQDNIIESHIVRAPDTKEHSLIVKAPEIDCEERLNQVPYSYTDNEIATRNIPVYRRLPFKHEVCEDSVKRVPKQIARSSNFDMKSYAPRQFLQPVRKTGWQEYNQNAPVKHRTVTKKRYTTESFVQQRYCTRTQKSMVTTELPVCHVPRTKVSCWPTIPATAVPKQDLIGVLYEKGALVVKYPKRGIVIKRKMLVR